MRFPRFLSLMLILDTSFEMADGFVSPRIAFRKAVADTSSLQHKASTLPQQQQQQQQQQQPQESGSVETNDDVQGIVPKKGGVGQSTASELAFTQNLHLGAPPKRPDGGHYLTSNGVAITAHVQPLSFGVDDAVTGNPSRDVPAIEQLVDKLDQHRGLLISSSYEFSGRYARWSLGFSDPPLEISGAANRCTIRALNQRGRILIPAVLKAMQNLKEHGTLLDIQTSASAANTANMSSGTGDHTEQIPTQIDVTVAPPPEEGTFTEEQRSRQPSLFSVVRVLLDGFGFQSNDGQLGLYGAFGYDLAFQFEPINLKQKRDPDQRDILLYLPDNIMVVDQVRGDAWQVSYDFCYEGKSTQGIPRTGDAQPFQPFQKGQQFQQRDTPKGDFKKSVESAKQKFMLGDLFEVVLSQIFRHKVTHENPPSVLYRRLLQRNPAPYGFFINLGEQEYLVGGSPEMFVRCQKTSASEYGPDALRIESCPISGTVARGADHLEDAINVKRLVANFKEESELTMCTDVDRNDKSRICIAGSVKVIGRRQIEMYSRLIHTVDHVEGYLKSGYNALDAFLSHMWAVTVTGAPKTWAIQFIEDTENSQRHWYGGAIGMLGFDGSMNTGLTLRTIRVKNGIAEVRAGATLLYDSEPQAEEDETELKASAMNDAISRAPTAESEIAEAVAAPKVGTGKKVILIDHQDSFVHTLGGYIGTTGAEVETRRSGPLALKEIEKMIDEGNKPDMVILSPGPGNPQDFGLSDTISFMLKHKIPTFGVCLGLQGMVEHFGGVLGVLDYPVHGKPSKVTLTQEGKAENSIFAGMPDTFTVARYHSLHGLKERMPSCLEITALANDGVVMGIQHSTLPFAAVQFHPESILTQPTHGVKILENALTNLKYNEDVANGATPSGAEIVGELEKLSEGELRARLSSAQMSTIGTKSELVIRLALWEHKSREAKAGRLVLNDMSVTELAELFRSLGLPQELAKQDEKDEVMEALSSCLLSS